MRKIYPSVNTELADEIVENIMVLKKQDITVFATNESIKRRLDLQQYNNKCMRRRSSYFICVTGGFIVLWEELIFNVRSI